jgi:hypothetical protein
MVRLAIASAGPCRRLHRRALNASMPRAAANPKEQDTLTPELRDFLDRATVPAIVRAYLAELAAADAPKSQTPGLPAPAKPIKDSESDAPPPLDTA